MSRRQRTGLMMVIAILFVDELLYSLIIPLVPYFTNHLHISSAMTGVLFSSYPIAALAATPFFGVLTDRVGRKKPIIIGLIILFLATLLFAFGESLLFLVISRAIQGIASAATWGAGLALLADLFPSEQRGKAMGFAFTGISTGTLLGAPFGGLLFELGGYMWPFIIAALFALINLILVIFWLPEPEVEVSERGDNGFFALMRNRAVLLVGGVILCASVTLTMLDPLLPILLGHEFGLSSLWIGVLFGMMTLAYALASPVFGALADRFDTYRMMFIGLSVIIVSLPLLSFSAQLSIVVVMMMIAGAGIGGALSPTMAALGDAVASAGQYGSAYALSNMIFMIGMIIGPLLGGVLADLWSVSVVLCLLSAVILLFLIVAASRRRYHG